jgi:hypothetical protein
MKPDRETPLLECLSPRLNALRPHGVFVIEFAEENPP